MKTKPNSAIIAVMACFLFGSPILRAQVPQMINYQGRVAVGGAIYSGTGQFGFAFVSPGGTSSYWSNDGSSVAGSEPSASLSIPVSQGLYTILLGDTNIATMMAIPTTVFSNPDVRLRIWFNDGVHGVQQLSPDQRIASVGYAMEANGVVNGAVTSAMIAAGAVGSTQIASNAVGASQIANNAVGTAQIAGGAVTGAQIANAAVGTPQLAASSVSFGNRVPRNLVINATGNAGDLTMGTSPAATIETGVNTQDEAIPNLNSVTLTTNGGPVIAMLVPINNGTVCYVGIAPATTKTDIAYFTLYRDTVSTNRIIGIAENNPQIWNITGPGAIMFLDLPPAGLHTYQLDAHTQGNGGQWIMSGCALVVFEL